MPSPLDSNYNLLLADADPTVGMTVTAALADHGHQVTVCRDGNMALQLVRKHAFDLAIVDINLPGLDGLQFLSACRRDDELSVMPVIILSASREEDVCDRAFALGANGYIVKPLMLPLLSHTVWEVIRSRARDQELKWLKVRLGIQSDRQLEMAQLV